MSNAPLSDTNSAPKKDGLLERFGLRSRKLQEVKKADGITEQLEVSFGLGGTTLAAVMGAGSDRRAIRERRVIYTKWQDMESNPIISTGLGLLVSAALGGHESTGQLVFIEPNPRFKGNAAMERMAQEIADDLGETFDNVGNQVAYTGCWGGDSYARIYSKNGKGVQGLHLDECYLPPMVQPYEQGGRTIGYSIYTGEKNWERLHLMQMARLKMPRKQFVPQHSVIEKSLRINVLEDDRDSTPLMPSLVGGSLLYHCEEPYDNLCTTLVGLVGSRLSDSINEEILGVNLAQMTKFQQKTLMDSIVKMLASSRDRAMEAIKRNSPVMEKIRHLIPMNGEKQVISMIGGNQPRQNGYSVEDVMFHARLLAGALGVDLSMIGFADQMAGGLGEGGFFRTSAQVGERARIIRTALTEFFMHVIDVHCALRYGTIFPVNQRPYQINYAGSISALEAERTQTRMTQANTTLLLTQTLDQLKNMGADEATCEAILVQEAGIDADRAKTYAKLMTSKRPGEDGGDGGGFGGGM